MESSELIINSDNSIYHLNLKPGEIAKDIIIVGDQGRVETVSSFFDQIEIKKQNREFVTHTGTYKGKRITVLSTGIGTDNIDIVLNELDALVNIDFEKRIAKEKLSSLNIIRLGTSGALQKDIPIESFLVSEYALGFDGLLNYYDFSMNNDENSINKAFIEQSAYDSKFALPYTVHASESLLEKICFDMRSGITATASGFYGPQGRELRLKLAIPDLNEKLTKFSFEKHLITNFEMETSALYGLGRLLGHNTLTICVIIANRIAQQFSEDYHPAVISLIKTVLDRIIL
ncbi:MAG: nucleoside phosphorylase [Bacteroidota bacterium]